MRRSHIVYALLMAAACSSNPGPRTPAPVRPVPLPPGAAAPRTGALPPIPLVDGPLAVDVVYPREGASLPTRDSTFIFGNVGTGKAELRINGAPVTVEPNGAFLAWLPVPIDGVYRLEATRDGQTARAERRVNIPAAPEARPAGPPRPVILSSNLSPRGTLALRAGEPLDITLRATRGARATLVLPGGRRVPLIEDTRGSGDLATYRAVIPAEAIAARDTAIRRPRVGVTAPDSAHSIFELVSGADTVRAPVPASIALLDPVVPVVGMAADPNPVGGDRDGYVVGRPAPGTVSHYFFPNGTELQIVEQRGSEYRVRLSDELSAWVSADEVRLLPPGVSAPASLVNNISIVVDTAWFDVRFPITRRLPFTIDERERELVLTLYGATSAADWLIYGARADYLEHAWWEQPRDGEFRFTVRLTRPVWGYQTFFDERGRLILRVRRPPAIDPANPLRGRLITLDPGHGPPEGRWGPTRLTESAANLAISLKLKELIEAAGGRVQMTRVDTSAVGLYDRPLMATRANADLFVSVHNNAVGDGTNPFTNHGTSTYFFHANSLQLARKIQNELVAEFGLPDLGYTRASLAVVRWPTWMPAVLTESMFFIMPEQEAALRDPAVIERIARAHLRGIEQFLRESAR